MIALLRAGRPVAPRRRRVGMSAVGILLGSVALLALPTLALAHPLGNFTINHYAGIRIEPDRVVLDVVIDQAEIPTFQEKLRIDSDGDGLVSDAEAEAERVTACPALAGSLNVAVGGQSLPLVPVEAGLSFPPGAAGLETMRLVCVYTAALAEPLADRTSVTFTDSSHAERIGWREIVVEGSGVALVSSLPRTSSSERLISYPKDMLAQPLDIRSASFTASPGGAVLDPLNVPDATPLPGAVQLYANASGSATVDTTRQGSAAQGGLMASGAVPGGVGAEISGLLETRDLTPLVLLVSLATAIALGAGHALTPGHGKTLMGAYLVGTRGTPIHAIALGLSVTVSHTIGILALAAIIVGFRGVVSPEAFNRIAPIVSGVLVLGIGGWLMTTQIRRFRHTAATSKAGELGPTARADTGVHHHPNEVEHHHLHGGEHDHGGIRHSHLPSAAPDNGPIAWRSLFVLGLAGGIIPSTNALIILLATVATGRAVYGLVLVVAFGLGMALVLGGVGLALVLARDRLDEFPARTGLGRVAAYAPMAAGVLVVGLGLYLTGQAVGGTLAL